MQRLALPHRPDDRRHDRLARCHAGSGAQQRDVMGPDLVAWSEVAGGVPAAAYEGRGVRLGCDRGLDPVAESGVRRPRLADVVGETLRVRARGVVGAGRLRSRVTCFSSAAAPRATEATAVTVPMVWSDQPTGRPNRCRMVTSARRLACSTGAG